MSMESARAYTDAAALRWFALQLIAPAPPDNVCRRWRSSFFVDGGVLHHPTPCADGVALAFLCASLRLDNGALYLVASVVDTIQNVNNLAKTAFFKQY